MLQGMKIFHDPHKIGLTVLKYNHSRLGCLKVESSEHGNSKTITMNGGDLYGLGYNQLCSAFQMKNKTATKKNRV